jgi:hypothetical protein
MPLLLVVLFIFCFNATFAQHPDSHVHCGTSYVLEQNLLKAQSGLSLMDERPQLTHQHFSPSGFFLIHYDTQGPNAVPLRDNDGNSVPDYVDSTAYFLEYSYQVQVVEMGYKAPPKDHAVDSAYDVYLVDNIQGRYFYGVTSPEFLPGSVIRSYIRLDNDFSSRDSIVTSSGRKQRVFYDTSYTALKVTAAHEFHHAIQLGSYGNMAPVNSIPEMTSAWMEYRVYPEIRTYEEYLPSLFKSLPSYPFSDASPSTGYRYGIFGQYVHAQFGDALFKRMWEIFADTVQPFQALDSAFKEQKSTLAEQWCGFLPWLYHTGGRAQEGKFFKNAELFPEAQFFYSEIFTNPSVTHSGFLKPFELRYLRIILPESYAGGSVTADIGLANIDTNALFTQQDINRNYSVTISKSFEAGSQIIPGTPYYLSVSHDNEICIENFISEAAQVIATPFPNPFKPRTDREAFFPVPIEAALNGKALLTIFKNDMEQVYSEMLPIEMTNSQFAVRWSNIPESLRSGVYIYTVATGEQRTLGKLAIQF